MSVGSYDWKEILLSQYIYCFIFFRTLFHGLQDTSQEATMVAAARAWWINPPPHPIGLIWSSETRSQMRKDKCNVLCVFIHHFGCAAKKKESARFGDPIRLPGFWDGTCCLILLSLMHQKGSRCRFGAQVTRENKGWMKCTKRAGKIKGAELGKV